MADCTSSMFDEWRNQAAADKDQHIKIEMHENFQKLTADIIAHTLFGSSYLQGRGAFRAQQELQNCSVASIADIFIPGSQ